ncbi:hemerythrin domain-containing protein [Sulfurimonas sp.]|uniref:hemerythrin domain-containing protein n=1 Tax=Sulfurimonas sp. TaxID=2022749 RepID=UPI0025FA8613|nr:hemerythrin domain-containing protein [Sulfurimonas sp.]MDD5158042.1 hemerythrin domain-containing protein [Sulfurimonas sp.]
MSNIKEFLTNDHRECDETFAEMEDAVASNSDNALLKFEKFYDDLSNHFSMEEIVLFQALAQVSAIENNPAKLMEMEHEQMRELLSKMRKALEQKDKEKFFSVSETLMILMQQHNMKEEQMLYTLAQRHLEDDAEHLISRMRSVVY